MPRILSLALLVLFFASSAEGKIQFKVSRIENKNSSPFSAEVKTQWTWAVEEEDVRTLAVLLSIRSPEIARYKELKSLSRSTKAQLKGDTLLVRLNGMSEKLLLQNGSSKLFLEIQAENDGDSFQVDENCKQVQIGLRSDPKRLPFYVGTSCKKTKESVFLSLTLPREVEITNSSLFETKGKGEPWRYYELGASQVASGVLGKLTATYKGKSVELFIFSLLSSTESKKEEAPRTLLAAGAGYGLLNISGASAFSGGQPILVLKVPHYPIVGGLGLMANMAFALPLSQGTNAPNYTQFEAFGSYEFIFGSFALRPKLGYVIFQQSEASGIGLNANQLGFGSQFIFSFGENYDVYLDAMLCGLGSSVIQSHTSFELGFMRRRTTSIGWGFGARLQSFSALGDSGLQRGFGQTLFFGMVSF
jgi:hypothetical protein